MKVVVTGANGYIGAHVVKKMLDMNVSVVAIDRSSSKVDMRAQYVNYDIFDNNKSAYDDLGQPDALLHLAWSDGFNHYAQSHIHNLEKHYHFIKKFIDAGCASITVMGTVHEIGYHEGKVNENSPCSPLSNYGIAKNALRQLVQIYTADKEISLKWLRAYYIIGDDRNNHSLFTKILELADKGETSFPFTKGTNQFDFITIEELSTQICAATLQTKIDGIINVCSGEPVAIKDVVEKFISDNDLKIKPDYGKFPQRRYDSPVVYGDDTKIRKIMKLLEKK